MSSHLEGHDVIVNPQWKELDPMMWPPQTDHKAARVWIHKDKKIRVLRSLATMENHSSWIHISVSHPSKKIDWTDLQMVKNLFIGSNRTAIQVFPKVSDLIDLHDVYHLWAPTGDWSGFAFANLKEIEMEEAL